MSRPTFNGDAAARHEYRVDVGRVVVLRMQRHHRCNQNHVCVSKKAGRRICEEPDQANDPDRGCEEIRDQQLLEQEEAGLATTFLPLAPLRSSSHIGKPCTACHRKSGSAMSTASSTPPKNHRDRHRASLRRQQQPGDQRDRKKEYAVFALERNPDDRAEPDPPVRIGALEDAQGVKRGERPKPQSHHIRSDFGAEAFQHAGREIGERRKRRSEGAPAELEGKQARNVGAAAAKIAATARSAKSECPKSWEPAARSGTTGG